MITIPPVFGEPAGVLLLGPLFLQKRQKSLLLLAGTVHEIVPRLEQQNGSDVNSHLSRCKRCSLSKIQLFYHPEPDRIAQTRHPTSM